MIHPPVLHFIEFGVCMAVFNDSYHLGSRFLSRFFRRLEHNYPLLYGLLAGN